MKGTTVTKVLTVLLIVFMLVSVMQPMVSADAKSPDTIISGITGDRDVETGSLQNMANTVLGIIQIATAVIAVVLIAVFGFKFVLGSAQEKADYQKSFIPLIIGVIVVFSATSIARLIFSVVGNG